MIGVGNISGNAVGLTTRGIDGTTATAHNDGSTITVLNHGGTATTVAANNSGASDTNIQIVATAGIDAGDYIGISGVGTAREIMKVTAVTTNSALTPGSVADWYES